MTKILLLTCCWLMFIANAIGQKSRAGYFGNKLFIAFEVSPLMLDLGGKNFYSKYLLADQSKELIKPTLQLGWQRQHNLQWMLGVSYFQLPDILMNSNRSGFSGSFTIVTEYFEILSYSENYQFSLGLKNYFDLAPMGMYFGVKAGVNRSSYIYQLTYTARIDNTNNNTSQTTTTINKPIKGDHLYPFIGFQIGKSFLIERHTTFDIGVRATATFGKSNVSFRDEVETPKRIAENLYKINQNSLRTDHLLEVYASFSLFIRPFGVLLLVITLLSCHKEHDFKEPVTINSAVTALDTNLPSYENWVKVPSNYSKVLLLTATPYRLYFGAKNGLVSYLVEYSDNLGFGLLRSFGGSNVSLMDIEPFNGKIYYSGCYKYTSTQAHLFCVDPVTYQHQGFPVSDNNSSYVKHLQLYQGNLVFTGSFSVNSFIASRPFTQLTTSNTTLAMGPPMNQPYGMFADGDNDLYAFSNGNLIGGAQSSNIAKWDGTQWVGMSYANYNSSETIQSLVEKNDTIYLTSYTQQWDTYGPYKLKRIVNNVMETLPDIFSWSRRQAICLSCQQRNICVWKKSFMNGTYTNVFKLVGDSWTIDKIILETVNDVDYFNGHVYAGTDDGLYRD